MVADMIFTSNAFYGYYRFCNKIAAATKTPDITHVAESRHLKGYDTLILNTLFINKLNAYTKIT